MNSLAVISEANITVSCTSNYFLRPDKLSCDDLLETQYVANFTTVFAQLGLCPSSVNSLLVLFTLLALATVAILIEEVCRLLFHTTWRTYFASVGILAVFPISTLTAWLTLLVPTAHELNIATATLYQSFGLVLFYKLVVSYAGREKHFWGTLMNTSVPKGPPFYFACFCVPSLSMNKTWYYLIKVAIYQMLVMPCLLYFAIGITTKMKIYTPGQLSFENAAIYLQFTSNAFFFAGYYCLSVFFRMAQLILPGFQVGLKFVLVIAYCIITRVLVVGFDIFGYNRIFLPCQPPVSSFAFGLYARSVLLLVIGFLMSLLARFVFLKPLPAREIAVVEVNGVSNLTCVAIGNKSIDNK